MSHINSRQLEMSELHHNSQWIRQSVFPNKHMLSSPDLWWIDIFINTGEPIIVHSGGIDIIPGCKNHGLPQSIQFTLLGLIC